jgi:hypothetical protein
MYFDNFPKMLYDFEINGQTEYKYMRDITHNVRVRKEVLANISLYDEYDIRDGETPEIIAEKVYGSPLYHWVVMLCNERYDYVKDFPVSQYELEQHILTTYGTTGQYATHHYINAAGQTVDSSYPGATSVSNYDYEMDENEKKRRIKLVSPALLSNIIKNFKDII